MIHAASRLLFVYAIAGLVIIGVNTPLRGEPSLGDLSRSDDPILVEARRVDVHFVGPEKANQQKAEELYLQYIHEHPESPLNSYICYHLGHMYSDWIASEWKDKYGLVRDDKKAGGFFEQSVKHHPKDKISGLLVGARVNVAALAPTPEEITDKYIEFYNWITSINKDEIADKLWLSEDEERKVEVAPKYKEYLAKNFWKSLQQMAEVAKKNMVATTYIREKGRAMKMLDKISADLPNTPPAQLAQDTKEKFEAQVATMAKRSDSRKAMKTQTRHSRTIPWIWLIVLIIIVGIFIARRRRVRKPST